MESYILIEGIGLAGSFLVALSMTMRHVKSLRLINLAGCLFFSVYGILIGSIPVISLNVFTGIVNLYYLFKARADRTRSDAFDTLFTDPKDDEYIRRFVQFHANDIKRFFPSFDPDPQTGSLAETECCLILRETQPVSLVAFRMEEGKIAIILDYAIPAYRDIKNGKFFFERAVSRIVSPGAVFTAVAEVPAHASYLRKLGFEETHRDEKGIHFKKEISDHAAEQHI